MYLYSRHEQVSSIEGLWILLGLLEASFAVFFGIFLSTIERKYVRSFFTRLTAVQFNQQRFKLATAHDVKISIFDIHPSYWKGIQVEVEQFVTENYSTWLDESPPWFTERVRESIPKYLRPSDDEGSTY